MEGSYVMNQTEIIAHRGSKGTHPENTLEAIEEAVRVGSDGIEIDVHLSLDKEIIVIHDETVNRTTDGKGRVQDLTLMELKKMNAGSWFSPEYINCRIPTLKEVFYFLADIDFKGLINIELKTDYYAYPGIEEKVLAFAAENNWPFTVEYSSFNYQTLIRLKEVDSSCKIALLFKNNGENVAFLDLDIPVRMWHPKLSWFKNKSLFKASEIPVRVWTVNKSEDIQFCLRKKVAGIITDYPQKALEIRNKW